MEKEKAYYELRRLVDKYIDDAEIKKELLDMLCDDKKYMPPVRGVLDDVLKSEKTLSKEDKEIIDELMYFFG